MTISSNNLVDAEFDMDTPMSSIETISEEEAANRGISEDDVGQGKPEATKSEKTEAIDSIEQLLDSSKLTAWERGFCGSCDTWLKSSPTAMLSYKQKAVLVKLVDKYFS